MDSLMHLSDLASKAEPINSVGKEENNNENQPSSSSVAPIKSGISSEDRKIIKDKLKAAYKKKSETYEELLELCSSVEEERTFSSAPSKLDYYKSGIQCVKQIFEKKGEIDQSAQQSVESCSSNKVIDESAEAAPKSFKRAKTQH